MYELVNATEMLKKAKAGHYAVGQFNINNLEWTKAILLTAQELNSPVILGVSEGAGKYMAGYKIREVIGSGGKVIQKISAECDVKIDISEDGSVFVSGIDKDKAEQAINIINTIANDPEIGAIYRGKVVKIMNFGAFVEIAPGKDGLVHISKLDKSRVEKVEDVVSVGDEIVVKVMEIDDQGRINLSRKDALADIEAKKNAK